MGDLLLLGVTGFTAFLGGIFGAAVGRRMKVRLPVPFTGEFGAHEHRFDSFRRDGKWRCGICNEAKEG